MTENSERLFIPIVATINTHPSCHRDPTALLQLWRLLALGLYHFAFYPAQVGYGKVGGAEVKIFWLTSML